MIKKMTIFFPFIWGIIFATSVIEVSGNETEFKLQQESPSVLNFTLTTGDIVTFPEMTDDGEYTRLSLPGFHLSRMWASLNCRKSTASLKFLREHCPVLKL